MSLNMLLDHVLFEITFCFYLLIYENIKNADDMTKRLKIFTMSGFTY